MQRQRLLCPMARSEMLQREKYYSDDHHAGKLCVGILLCKLVVYCGKEDTHSPQQKEITLEKRSGPLDD